MLSCILVAKQMLFLATPGITLGNAAILVFSGHENSMLQYPAL